MIGGKDPLIIFYYTTTVGGVELPLLPVPIYLAENKSGFIVKGCNTSMAIQSENVAGNIFQRGVSSSTTININCSRNNPTANTFLPLLKTMFALINGLDGLLNKLKAVAGHKVALFYGHHVILFGKISAMTWADSDNNDLVEISLTIDEGKENTTAAGGVLGRTPGSALVRAA